MEKLLQTVCIVTVLVCVVIDMTNAQGEVTAVFIQIIIAIKILNCTYTVTEYPLDTIHYIWMYAAICVQLPFLIPLIVTVLSVLLMPSLHLSWNSWLFPQWSSLP